jgi:hypothetical protein
MNNAVAGQFSGARQNFPLFIFRSAPIFPAFAVFFLLVHGKDTPLPAFTIFATSAFHILMLMFHHHLLIPILDFHCADRSYIRMMPSRHVSTRASLDAL